MFVRHHIHSIMSTRDAMLKIEDIVNEAIKYNESFSICDHGSIASWIQLYNICKKKKIKPIFGIEAYINQHRDRLLELVEQINSMGDADKDLKKTLQIERDKIKKYDHIVLIAKNLTGFQNIIELANIGFVKGFYGKPTITYDELMKYKEGIIISTACLGSTLNKYITNDNLDSALSHINYLKDNFGDDLFLEVQANGIEDQVKVNKEILKLSKKTGVKIITGSDSHYLGLEGRDTHQDLLLLQNGNKRADIGKFDLRITFENGKGEIKTKKVAPDAEFRKGFIAKDVNIGDTFRKDVIIDIKEVPRVWEFAGDAAYISQSEIIDYINENHSELKKHIDEIFYGNNVLYDMIENIEIDTSIKLPVFENEEKILVKKIQEALIEKGFSKKRKYIERAKYELQVIKKNGFASYFLILADFIEFAKTKEIPIGAGRGSGASSLVAYLLGIHRINPLDKRWGEMPFERFLSMGKLSNKIVIYDEEGNKKEFVSQDLIKIKRNKNIIEIEAKDLKEGDEFIEVMKRFSI